MTVQGPTAEQTTAEAERVLAAGGVVDGARLLNRAAELGSARAVTLLAHFKASGVAAQADWDGALDQLQRAAEMGWAPALDELRVLARGHEGAPSDVRKRVDIRAWVAPRPSQVVREAPLVRTLPAFMSADECAWMIGLGRPKLQAASVYGVGDLGSEGVSARTNTTAPLLFLDIDIVCVFLAARIAHSVGLPSAHFEPPAVLHYSPGEQFRPHFDFLNAAIPAQLVEIQRGGQRLATFLVYLNEGYDGGETAFPRLDYAFKGKTGDALVFANVSPSGEPDPRTMHAGTPTTRGEKWLLSQWIRDRPQ